MSPIQTIGSGGISASSLNQLISASMALERRPLELMKAEKDQIELQRSVYNDLAELLESLDTGAEGLLAGSSALTGKQVLSGDPSILTATASTGTANGIYSITDVVLARAHQVRSLRVTNPALPLGLTGSFVLGARADASAAATLANADSSVTAASVAAVASGQLELGRGQYHVEFRNSGSTETPTWEFRLVDDQGQAMSIANGKAGAASGSFTSSWQSLNGAKEAGAYDFDTGRGLVIRLDATPTEGKLYPSAPRIDYVSRGAEIDVEAGHSLQDVRNTINSATYAEGERVQATIVDNQLVLTAASTGERYRIPVAGAGSGSILSSLELWDGASGWMHPITPNAESLDGALTVNGITLHPSRNSGLTNVIDGLTLNLAKSSSSGVTLTVQDDNATAKGKINSFIATYNKVLSYLNSKTAVTKNSDDTYTRGALANDSIIERLKLNLIKDISAAVSGLSAGAPTALRALGITFDHNEPGDTGAMSLAVTDSSALDTLLAKNRPGAVEMLNKVMERLRSRLQSFTGSSGVLTKSAKVYSNEADDLTDRIREMEERMTAREALLTARYSTLLGQLAQMQSQSSYLSSLMGGTSLYG